MFIVVLVWNKASKEEITEETGFEDDSVLLAEDLNGGCQYLKNCT